MTNEEVYKITLERILNYRLRELKEEGYFEMLNSDLIVVYCRNALTNIEKAKEILE